MSHPTPLPRPTLLPGLTRLWRDRHTLQLGLAPGRAVLLEVANPRATRLLDLLDGTRSERAVLAHAATDRVAPDEARALLDTLRAAGLVVPAHSLLPRDLVGPARARLADEADALALAVPAPPATPAQVVRRRRAARIRVTGAGPLGATIAVGLAQAGVGHVLPDLAGPVRPADLVGTGLTAADVGRPRAVAVRDALRRCAPDTATAPPRRGRIELVVQLGSDRPAALLAAGYAQRRQPHLLVDLRGGVPVVGPLVRPPVGPCLNCLDLHRVDRDPDWPRLAAQLAVDHAERACAATTRLAAAAYAVAEVLAHLDGGTPETLGCAVEVTRAGRFRRRPWAPHPSCGCSGRRPIRRSPHPLRLDRSSGGPESVTMAE
ncbi:TOMM precursor leader peptide-binding protein [Micromonospora auratinigra]|uniref:Bacteriocin biosynthesis cyclodehydratase domain-containing protein n=1 Tax=Micromonospora auratinigra TaxID=261654 RepID=A0A1A8ZTE3_9ACTN|nr:TOMM precursor leader peptide-binding protein [Micromonospora auratinigra]SBT47147.1 bacteriocin biosynthesis cyclodehydratase domain-containing protein [Micromonospora auratinigra]